MFTVKGGENGAKMKFRMEMSRDLFSKFLPSVVNLWFVSICIHCEGISRTMVNSCHYCGSVMQ